MSAKKKSKATRSGKSPVRKKTAASPRSGPGSSAPAAVAADPKTPIHQWTNGGSRVLILRCGEVGYNGFQWPTTVGATVVAPDPDRRPVCGGGLHGWPWGLAFGEGKEPDWTVKWLVFAADPADVILLEGKVKCVGPVEIVHVGSMLTAWNFVLAGQMAWSHYYADGAPASSSGDGAPASSSGDGAPASSSGTRAPASSSGTRAPASSSGYGAPASSSGYGAPAKATGACSAAVATNIDAKAQAGPFGVIALGFYNRPAARYEMRCARIGVGDASDGLLKALTWYRLDSAGEFIETT